MPYFFMEDLYRTSETEKNRPNTMMEIFHKII